MNLEKATRLIGEHSERMNAAYGGTVFDEWVLVSFVGSKEEIIGYVGPRPGNLRTQFASDLHAIKEELFSTRHSTGEFEFARTAGGTHFDAFVVVGDWLYLICNHTGLAMDEIAAAPGWRQAQIPFVELCEKFRADPLRLS